MSVELHFKHASPVSGFMKVQNCAFLGINLHFILVSTLCHLRKKEPHSCFSNTIEGRLKVIADFLESEFL